MFNIEMLPANEGDALWVEYGDPQSPRRVLIDCGYKSTYRKVMERIDADPDIQFELFVLTHIDGDHIAGAVPFFADSRVDGERVQEVWFNSREHISDKLGVEQAEFFTKILKEKRIRWNSQFGGRAIFLEHPEAAHPIKLDGGMRITLLSPGATQLKKLEKGWSKDLEAILKGRDLATVDELVSTMPPRLQPDKLGTPRVEDLAAKAFDPDDTAPNGSSIAFIAEYDDAYDGDRTKSVLFLGDAHAPVIAESILKLLKNRGGAKRLVVDAVKVSHHGSARNTSAELLRLIRAHHFLISTNGSRHSHPDPECIARIVTSQDQRIHLHFNYQSKVNEDWGCRPLEQAHNYRAHYPSLGEEGLAVIF